MTDVNTAANILLHIKSSALIGTPMYVFDFNEILGVELMTMFPIERWTQVVSNIQQLTPDQLLQVYMPYLHQWSRLHPDQKKKEYSHTIQDLCLYITAFKYVTVPHEVKLYPVRTSAELSYWCNIFSKELINFH